MSKYKHGLTTEEHNKMNVDAYYARAFERLRAHKGGVIVDAFSGGPRDTLKMMDVLDGDGIFVAIDNDTARIDDLVNKNFDIEARRARQLIVPEFRVFTDARFLDGAHRNDHVAVIEHTFPASRSGKDLPSPLKADFMLCNAGIMFIQPEDLNDTLGEIAGLLNHGGELVLRFSQARADKETALGKSYFIHNPDHVRGVLEECGLQTERFGDVPDPQRDFSWVDINALRPY